jgi:hypothetical protein
VFICPHPKTWKWKTDNLFESLRYEPNTIINQPKEINSQSTTINSLSRCSFLSHYPNDFYCTLVSFTSSYCILHPEFSINACFMWCSGDALIALFLNAFLFLAVDQRDAQVLFVCANSFRVHQTWCFCQC